MSSKCRVYEKRLPVRVSIRPIEEDERECYGGYEGRCSPNPFECDDFLIDNISAPTTWEE